MKEKSWVWQSNGTELDYVRFHPGEPNGGTFENCLMMKEENGNWGDMPCQETGIANLVVCEKATTKPTLSPAVEES